MPVNLYQRPRRLPEIKVREVLSCGMLGPDGEIPRGGHIEVSLMKEGPKR